jgi:acyl-CoA dehydrogenase
MTDSLLADSVEAVLSDRCTFEAVQVAEAGGWAPGVWDAIAEMGLPWISVSEEAGGSGGTLEDAMEVLRVAGRHAAPVPLAETGLLGGWLAAAAGFAIRPGPVTVVPGRPDDTLAATGGALTGMARGVAWARRAERILALVADGDQLLVASVAPDRVTIEPGTNLAGEPRDAVTFDGVVPDELVPAPAGIDRRALHERGALTRVALMAGALARVSEITIEYTSQRNQFGRPVASFQAVQAHLVHGAQQAALAAMAAATAARAAGRGPATFEIAAAKTVANQAATTGVRHAHQAHGAIGMTREYPLHQLSRRLWSWRDEYGSEAQWSTRLGIALARAGADALYPAITGGSTVLMV